MAKLCHCINTIKHVADISLPRSFTSSQRLVMWPHFLQRLFYYNPNIAARVFALMKQLLIRHSRYIHNNAISIISLLLP